MLKKVIQNPFWIYVVVWIFSLALYSLHYSDLYPVISLPLASFLLLTVLLSFLLGYRFKSLFSYKKVESINVAKIKRYLFLFYILAVIEFVSAAGFIPIVAFLSGNYDLKVGDFGLPYIHVIICNGMSFLAIYSFHCYRSTSDRRIRRKLMYYIMAVVFMALLFLSRSMLMIIFLGILFVYLLSSQNLKKNILAGCIFSIIGLYVFGLLGDLRTDRGGRHHIILDIGLATEEFRESYIPSEFFWGYLYITSPISNLQNTIDQCNVDGGTSDFVAWTICELMPDIAVKRVTNFIQVDRKAPVLIVDALNVSTVYANSYVYLGWEGMFGMFFFTAFFILFSLLFIPKNSPFFVSGVVCINVIIVLNIFDNMFNFMGLVPHVFIAILLSVKYFYKRIILLRKNTSESLNSHCPLSM